MRSLSFAWRILYGPLAWAAQFLVVYASESLFCLHGPGGEAHRLFAAAVSLAAALGVALPLLFPNRRPQEPFGRLLALLALVAIAWTALPVLALPACTAPV